MIRDHQPPMTLFNLTFSRFAFIFIAEIAFNDRSELPLNGYECVRHATFNSAKKM